MRALLHNGKYVIARGQRSMTYFLFFVDHDSSCWSKRIDSATQYDSPGHAAHAIVNLRQRQRLRKQKVVDMPHQPW